MIGVFRHSFNTVAYQRRQRRRRVLNVAKRPAAVLNDSSVIVNTYRRGRITAPFNQSTEYLLHFALNKTTQTQQSSTPTVTPSVVTATLNDSAQAPVSGNPTVTFELIPADTAQTSKANSPVLYVNLLAPLINTAQAVATSTASVIEHSTLTALETAQTSVSELAIAGQIKELNSTAQAQLSSAPNVTQYNVVTATETTQTSTAAVNVLTQHNAVVAIETAQASVSDTPTATISSAAPLSPTATVQTQVGSGGALTEHATVSLNETSQSSTSGVARASFITVFETSPQILIRRGTRILPENYDRKLYSKDVTGTASVQASDATVVAQLGIRVEGDAAVTANPAQVTAWAVVPAFRIPDYVLPPFIHRRGGYRRLIEIDHTIFSPITEPDKRGVISAVATAATAAATAERVVTGAVVAAASNASVIARANNKFGEASVTASDAAVYATGTSVFGSVGVVQASDAIVVITGVREITGDAAISSLSAAVTANGNLAGVVAGAVTAQAQDATATLTGSRGYVASVVANASDVSVSAVTEIVGFAPPEFDTVDTILSRAWRPTVLDFSRYLNQGSEPLTWVVTQGALPTGLVLDSVTGVITGTPTTNNVYQLAVSVSNITGADTSNIFTWVISDSVPRDGLVVNQNVVSIRGL